MFKKILCLVFFIFMINSSLYAMNESNIESVMKSKIEIVLNILKDEKLEKLEKTKNIFSIMDEVFDYQIMSQIALGAKWKEINDDEKKSFVKAFETKLKNSYVEKLELYNDQNVEFSTIEKLNPKRIKLQTFIIGKDDKYEVEYKFYLNSSDEWLIYDVSIIGVSIMQTNRQQFALFLEKHNIKELIEKLNKNEQI